MNAKDFIDFAAKIAATYSDAAACRSSISRAYYGAFHIAKSFLDRLGSRPFQNANAHIFVQHRLMNCGHHQAVRAGRFLRDLFRDRLLADYSLPVRRVENVEYARVAVESAREVQSLIEACACDEAIVQIKAGLADYERRISGT
jgi:uncharacterized protein (UPF0332 family)